MKKSIVYLLSSIILLSGTITFGEEINNSNVQNLSMPTDEEIMQTIKKYNFDKSQQEYLFKETKRKLEEMYSHKDFSMVLEGDSTLINNSSEVKEKAKNTKKYATYENIRNSK